MNDRSPGNPPTEPQPTGASLALDAMLDSDHPIKLDAAQWARNNLGAGSGTFRPELWPVCAERGLQGIMVPTGLGGGGAGVVEALLTFEGLGLGCEDNGLVFALSSQVFAMQSAFLSAASPEQLDRWLPGLLDGTVRGAFAMSEANAGSDANSITTTAIKTSDPGEPDRYVLNGSKCWITLGPVADVAIVFATTDPALGRWGITAFVVATDRLGVTVGEPVEKMGLTSSPFGEMHFDDCELGEADRLGPEGAGGGIFTAAVEGERAFLYAAQLGSAERVLNRTIERARTRYQFGKPIGANQAVSHRIADMKLELEMSRLLIYKTAALADADRSVSMAAALAKLQASESAVASAMASMQIHGAEGYTTSLGIERELRDAVGGLAYSGTSDIQRMIVARMLRVDAPMRRRSVENNHDERQ
jgi:alkylation response protein AidB-like acyl-CoA dehydrogenase